MPFANGDLGDQNVTGASAAYDNISAGSNFFYKGDELQTLLDGKAGRIVGYHARNTQNPTAVATGVEQGFMRCNFIAKANQNYRLRAFGSMGAAAGPFYASVNVKLTSGPVGAPPADPTFATTAFAGSVPYGPPGGVPAPYSIEKPLSFTVDTDVRMLLSYIGNSPASTTFRMFTGVFVIDELAGDLTDTGVDDDTASGPPPKVLRSFYVQASASRSYDGAGQRLSYDNQYMMQGDIRIDGNRRSWGWFPLGAAGSGSLADMIGVSAANTTQLQLFLYYPHWYYSGGGRSVIGYHNQAAVTATEQGGGIYGQVFNQFTGRNQGKWIDIRGTSLATAIRNGTFKGIILGNTGDASFNDYGYAYGANGVNGQRLGLRASYYK